LPGPLSSSQVPTTAKAIAPAPTATTRGRARRDIREGVAAFVMKTLIGEPVTGKQGS
jgi:hypothetical protein